MDDIDPTITSGNTGTNAVEIIGAGQTVYTITADANDGGTISSYAIAGTDVGSLTLTGNVVKLTANPDYETKNSYSFTATATDASGNASASKTVTFSVTDVATELGGFYQGGVVFHLFEDGETGYVSGETHGLIAAVQDLGSGIRWYNGSYVTTEATSTALGTGATNTTTIISVQGATETSYAAGLARAYTGGGYTDWFLPSKDELNKMYLNRATINTTAASNSGSDFGNSFYWSSTEGDYNSAWLQYFTSGSQYDYGKYFTYYVRAVRAF